MRMSNGVFRHWTFFYWEVSRIKTEVGGLGAGAEGKGGSTPPRMIHCLFFSPSIVEVR